MTLEQAEMLDRLMKSAAMRFENGNCNRQEEALNAQAYASCCIAIQLDRIATALSDGIDPEIATTLNRIAAGVELLEHS